MTTFGGPFCRFSEIRLSSSKECNPLELQLLVFDWCPEFCSLTRSLSSLFGYIFALEVLGDFQK